VTSPTCFAESPTCDYVAFNVIDTPIRTRITFKVSGPPRDSRAESHRIKTSSHVEGSADDAFRLLGQEVPFVLYSHFLLFSPATVAVSRARTTTSSRAADVPRRRGAVPQDIADMSGASQRVSSPADTTGCCFPLRVFTAAPAPRCIIRVNQSPRRETL